MAYTKMLAELGKKVDTSDEIIARLVEFYRRSIKRQKKNAG